MFAALGVVPYSQKRPFAEKYVVQHIKKFAQSKKKQYLCSVKTRGYINIVLLIAAIILAIIVLHRALIHNIVAEISQMCI